MNDVVLQARGLVKEFGGLRAVDSLDFTLRRGELRCVIGPNGAGKSTLFKLLTGQLNSPWWKSRSSACEHDR